MVENTIFLQGILAELFSFESVLKERIIFSKLKTKQLSLMKDAAESAEKVPISNFLIPIAVNKANLEKTLNERIDGDIFSNQITEDKMKIVVKKAADIRLDLGENRIKYTVPLHIYVKRAMVLTDVEAEGDILLAFVTKYHFGTTWTINTETELVDYEWIRKPNANVLGFKIPVKSIAERVIRTSSKEVTNAIDKQVNENFILKPHAEQAWAFLQNPFPVFPAYDVRFKITPTDLAIAPLKMVDSKIVSTLFVQGNTQVGIGEQTNFVNNSVLPPLQMQDFGTANGFKLNVTAEIPFVEVEKVILKNFKGEEYSFGKKKIIVEDLKVAKEEEFMTFKVLTSGDYEGWLNLKGMLRYNDPKNQLELEDVAFSLDTKNLAQLDANFILNGLFTSKLQGSLAYPLANNLALIKKQANELIKDYKIQEGIHLQGNLQEITIEKAVLKAESVLFGVRIGGKVKLLVDSIP